MTRLDIIKMVIASKLIYKFHYILIYKTTYFSNRLQANLRIHMEAKEKSRQF